MSFLAIWDLSISSNLKSSGDFVFASFVAFELSSLAAFTWFLGEGGFEASGGLAEKVVRDEVGVALGERGFEGRKGGLSERVRRDELEVGVALGGGFKTKGWTGFCVGDRMEVCEAAALFFCTGTDTQGCNKRLTKFPKTDVSKKFFICRIHRDLYASNIFCPSGMYEKVVAPWFSLTRVGSNIFWKTSTFRIVGWLESLEELGLGIKSSSNNCFSTW